MDYSGYSGSLTLKPAPSSVPGAPRRPAPRRPVAPRRAPAKKKPCKYGPRGSDGLCPKKPRAYPTTGSTSPFLPDEPAPKKAAAKRKESSVSAYVRRKAERKAERQVEAVIRKKAAPVLGKVLERGAKAGAYLRQPLGKVAAGGATAIGGAAALVTIAGLASYFGTTYILKKIKGRRDRLQAMRDAAADAYRASRLAAIEQLGRPLTATEHKALAAKFKAAMATIGG
jgi:hypothetical protein